MGKLFIFALLICIVAIVFDFLFFIIKIIGILAILYILFFILIRIIEKIKKINFNSSIKNSQYDIKEEIEVTKEMDNSLSSMLKDTILYEIIHNRGKLIVYNSRMEIFKDYKSEPFLIRCDETNMSEFNLEGYELSLFNDECKLVIRCSEIDDSFTNDVEILIFDINKEEELQEIIKFLNNKLSFRKKYIEKNNNEIGKSKIERPSGKNKCSNIKFKDFDNNKVLRFSYYGVEIKGVKYRNLDINEIDVNKFLTFEFEPTNEYDKNAIKILYNNVFIGYVPKNNIQKVLKKYIVDDHKYVTAFVSKVDEEQQRIYMSVGLYEEFDENDLVNNTYYDIKLIKTTKKDTFADMTRQENLTYVKVGDKVSLNYDYELGTYIVEHDYLALELGEINKKYSNELYNHQFSGKKLNSVIIKLEKQDDKISCTIRVMII